MSKWNYEEEIQLLLSLAVLSLESIGLQAIFLLFMFSFKVLPVLYFRDEFLTGSKNSFFSTDFKGILILICMSGLSIVQLSGIL